MYSFDESQVWIYLTILQKICLQNKMQLILHQPIDRFRGQFSARKKKIKNKNFYELFFILSTKMTKLSLSDSPSIM